MIKSYITNKISSVERQGSQDKHMRDGGTIQSRLPGLQPKSSRDLFSFSLNTYMVTLEKIEESERTGRPTWPLVPTRSSPPPAAASGGPLDS